ncbi:MAG: S8 family peptidase [Methanothrix sp.]|nr:S8 family peptidase [Methanothrix sp.]
MDRKGLILVSVAIMIASAYAVATSSDSSSDNTGADRKIDPALVEHLLAGDSKKIPVIVLLKGESDQKLEGLDVKYRYRLIPGVAGEAAPSAIDDIAKSNFVQGIYYDESAQISTPNNNSSGSEAFYGSSSLSASQYIGADKLWKRGIDGRGVTVAVIDSGIDENHPDLVGKVVGEKNFLADETTTDDLLGHGTMVAGIIAGSGAASNGKYRGVAPGADLLSVKVINSKGEGRVSDIIAGIEWAIYNGADILSLSLGGINLGETNPPITMAADKAADAGVVVCVAAGNRNSSKAEGQTFASQADSDRSTVDLSQVDGENKDVYLLLVPIVLALPPGLIDSPGDGVKVITMGATDYNGHMAGFSGSGPTRDDRIKPDVVAPGVGIVSTIPPGLEKPDYIDEYYARESGTSLSTPVAAGFAALMLQENANITPAGIKAVMIRGAHKLNNSLGEQYEEYYQGAGLLDAPRSYQLVSDDVCGVIPDQWIAGRWAYLPAGKGVYVGLDTGADRPQKKLYALAPGDEDWNTRFVLFSNRERVDLKVSASGPISDWISLQALPRQIDANSQVVFAASIAVPNGTLPGIYSGSLDVTESGKSILSIPVHLTVAEPLEISKGLGSRTGTLSGNQWDYYYLDVPKGAGVIKAELKWNVNSSLDLFLLSPTSEYYSGTPEGLEESMKIESPPSGRWLMAVHSENSSLPVNYTLDVECYLIKTDPQRWNIDSATAGTSTVAKFIVENRGPALEDLRYEASTENSTSWEFPGHVGYKETWNKTINVTEKTRMISAELRANGGSNKSEVALVFENPEGIAKEENAALGSGDVGPVEIFNPESGRWTLKVYGYDVPKEGQSFLVSVKMYEEAPWNWITIDGPGRLESDSNETVEANLTIPRNISLTRFAGHINIFSGNRTVQIPIKVAVAGATLEGLTSTNVTDIDHDGHFDSLDLGFKVNATTCGDLRLNGVLTDCSGNVIDLFSRSFRSQKSSSIDISFNGSNIWMKGKCGPLKIRNLILYDGLGNFVDRYEKNITIEKDPKQFQAPAAYFTGGFVNLTSSSKIKVGVNVSVTKAGDYQVSGTIVDDNGALLGEDSVKARLVPGNSTIVLEFNPTKFMMLGDITRVHLVDLVLSRDGSELERKDDAWVSDDMSPKGFGAGRSEGNANNSNNYSTAGVIRMQDGKVVIS